MSIIEHLLVEATMGIYHSIRQSGYEENAFDYFKHGGLSETLARNKAKAFAVEMEEAKERNASKSERQAICLKHNLPKHYEG